MVAECQTREYASVSEASFGVPPSVEGWRQRPHLESTPERLEWAKKTLAGAKEGKRLTRPEIYAGEALQLAAFPAKVPVLLQAMRIGSLGIAAIPCEVYGRTGLKIKRGSPLKPTMNISLANGCEGYLPPPDQFPLGGYTT